MIRFPWQWDAFSSDETLLVTMRRSHAWPLIHISLPLHLPFTFIFYLYIYLLPLHFTFYLYIYILPLHLHFTFTFYLLPLPLPFTFKRLNTAEPCAWSCKLQITSAFHLTLRNLELYFHDIRPPPITVLASLERAWKPNICIVWLKLVKCVLCHNMF